jgi:hypothetical protein
MSIGIDDAEVVGYSRDQENLSVSIVAWNNIPILITFKAVFFAGEWQAIGAGLEAFIECTDSETLRIGRSRMPLHGYPDEEVKKLRHFAFRDVQGNIVLDVLCKGIGIQYGQS